MEHARLTGEQKRRLLLCATDAGGARNLAAVREEAGRNRFDIRIVTRRALSRFFHEPGDKGGMVFSEDLAGGIGEVMRSFPPDVVICGTTRYESPDREAVALARERGVPCVAVVDEWYNYRMRFCDEGSSDLSALPTVIALPDESARREAIEEGLPPEICHATGSPSLSRIWSSGVVWRTEPPPFPRILEDAREARVVLFLSENHAADYGSEPGTCGPLGPFLGYTEQDVRRMILEVLGALPEQFVFVEKPHPSEENSASPSSLPANVDYRRATANDLLHPLCYHSRIVLGMRSMALLEAALLGCYAVSIQPALAGPQVCTAVRLGLIPLVASCDGLKEWFVNLPLDRRGIADVERPEFARPDAAQNILNLIEHAK